MGIDKEMEWMEEWKTLLISKDEHTTEIEVSNKGSIRYKETGKHINNHTHKRDGYVRNVIRLRPHVKTNKLNHRLVAEAWLDNPENKEQVNHINGIKDDNRVENLEWCTAKENMKHALKNNLVDTKLEYKLKYKDAEEIRQRIKQGESVFDLAEEYGVSDTSIRDIKNYNSFKHEKIHTNFIKLDYDKFNIAEEIRRLKLTTDINYVELGRMFNMSKTNARNICNQRTWKREVYLNEEEIKRIEKEEEQYMSKTMMDKVG